MSKEKRYIKIDFSFRYCCRDFFARLFFHRLSNDTMNKVSFLFSTLHSIELERTEDFELRQRLKSLLEFKALSEELQWVGEQFSLYIFLCSLDQTFVKWKTLRTDVKMSFHHSQNIHIEFSVIFRSLLSLSVALKNSSLSESVSIYALDAILCFNL